MPKIVIQIPEDIYRSINEEVNLGIFPNISEAVSSALRKTHARKSRAYLRWLMKKERISKSEMLKELSSIR